MMSPQSAGDENSPNLSPKENEVEKHNERL
jgi:hypothetical protein